jgi:hypothetical protein
MAKKKRKAPLPRVTVLAYSRRELAQFAESVERLGLYVEELRAILATRKPAISDAEGQP